MMSTRSRYAFAIGVLIAIGAGAGAAASFARPSHASDPTAALATTVLAAATTSQQNTITVVGSGTATGVPDEAILVIGVQASDPDVHLALTNAATDMTRLLGALHAQGVAAKDIQTSNISIYEQNNCCPQTAPTYISSNQVSVTVHHLANVSHIIEAAVGAVGNDIQLNGVSLSISDPSPLVKAARAAAMTDAGARAQAWAGLAHHHIGGIIALSEIISEPAPNPCNGCGKGGGGGVPIQPGQTDVTVTITAVYELVA